MSETSTCLSPTCNLTVDGTAAKCPRCGRPMRSSKRIRALGWLLVLIGLFLVGLMGTIGYRLAPALLHPGLDDGGGGRFTGTPEQARLILGLFGLIIVFGVGATINGAWQIATGRRSRVLMFATLALAAGIALTAYTTTRALG